MKHNLIECLYKKTQKLLKSYQFGLIYEQKNKLHEYYNVKLKLHHILIVFFFKFTIFNISIIRIYQLLHKTV